MPASGGYIANNYRQGYRAEYLARYIISHFGPCDRIDPENDYGLDLIAAVMQKAGTAGIVSSMYGIQVKSGEAPFRYYGEYLMDWIRAYNIPILMCRAHRDAGRVQLYSTWTLHHLILDDGGANVQTIDFVEQYGAAGEAKLRMPEISNSKATVWLGDPIIDVSATELDQKELVNEIARTLEEWVGFDAMNYFRRKAEIPIIFGYLTWETNRSLGTSQRLFYKPHFFGPQHTTNMMKLIQDCATLITLNRGKDSQLAKDLAELIRKHGIEIPEFTKEVLGV
jgi:hypothetical protein